MIRKSRGGAIAETGPALLLLIALIIVPVMDLLYMGLAYGFAWFLHNSEIRELAVNPPNVAQSQTFLNKVDNDFVTSSFGFASFLGINAGSMSTKIQHANPTYTAPVPPNTQGSVTLTTKVTVRPWLYIPFFVQVPGITADMVFSFTSEKPQEENGQNN
ncbi:MAG TPA: hypothetical protein V6D22_05925 [Candidatus Obscuribacterales bacterium]